MGQQLLLEENLSERLLPLLIERFLVPPTCMGVVGLGSASGLAI